MLKTSKPFIGKIFSNIPKKL